jgi:hypothetical protein
VSGVQIDGVPLGADAIVIAMGPWSILAAQWLPLPAVFGQQSPSLVYDTGAVVPANALFLEYHENSGAELSVEVFRVPMAARTSPRFRASSRSRPTRLRSNRNLTRSSVYRPFVNGCRPHFRAIGSSPGRPAFVRSRRITCR